MVASEVKELANETSKATSEISSKITGIQRSAGEAISSIEEVIEIMAEVENLSTAISSAVEEQSVTTSEISRTMGETSGGLKNIVSNIAGVAMAAKDSSQKCIETKESAEGLGTLADKMMEIVKLFEGNGSAGIETVSIQSEMERGPENTSPGSISNSDTPEHPVES